MFRKADILVPENHDAIIQIAQNIDSIECALFYLRLAGILTPENRVAIILNTQYAKNIVNALDILYMFHILTPNNCVAIIQNAKYAKDIVYLLGELVEYSHAFSKPSLNQTNFDKIIQNAQKHNQSFTPYALTIAAIVILASLGVGALIAISILSAGTVPAFLAGLVGLTGLLLAVIPGIVFKVKTSLRLLSSPTNCRATPDSQDNAPLSKPTPTLAADVTQQEIIPEHTPPLTKTDTHAAAPASDGHRPRN